MDIAKLLDAIATQSEARSSALELGRKAGLSETDARAVVPAMLKLLKAFGVLDGASEEQNGVPTSSHARGFLRSLSEYVRNDLPILQNWERPGVEELPTGLRQAMRGPQFLYLMEQQRSIEHQDAEALRSSKVVQVVIKGRSPWRRQGARYLVLYDQQARQYQLPGGHVRESDAGNEEAAVRELEEELPGLRFDSKTDSLKFLGSVRTSEVSRTHSVLTSYEIDFFLLILESRTFPKVPNGRWIRESELLGRRPRGKPRDPLNTKGVMMLDEALAGGVSGLPAGSSLRGVAVFQMFVTDHRWELIGLFVGLTGIVLSLIPLLR